MDEQSRGVFAISVAAEMTSMQIQTCGSMNDGVSSTLTEPPAALACTAPRTSIVYATSASF